jgi:hypothetical protein
LRDHCARNLTRCLGEIWCSVLVGLYK